MGRKYDLVDVMAAVGLVATLFGGYLLVTAADGFWQAPISPTMNSVIAGNEPSTGMQYLQPVLGQAIVQDLLLDRDAGAALSASAMELNRAVSESERIFTALLSPLVLAELRAFGQETDHRARMQYVMGKSIVNQTRRGIAAGILSADQYGGEFNTNLIRTAELIGQRMHDQFEATRPGTSRSGCGPGHSGAGTVCGGEGRAADPVGECDGCGGPYRCVDGAVGPLGKHVG
ncbi:MAG: hypothetical protein DYH03_05940 [Nitrospira sp. NTP1]|nr:hypothetical protein [Nitrospira sp. NTP1]